MDIAKVCAKIFQEGIIPPTINLENPDLEAGCDLDYVPNVAYHYPTHADIPKAILSDNLGFGEYIKDRTLLVVEFCISFMNSFVYCSCI